jgi:A/G-specific adenine glycosylase
MLLSRKLLKWYDDNHRHLPWRANPGEIPNPYHVWVSEIMLQQTTVPTVINYFNRFIKKWPTIQDLAQASLDDVLHAWQGLGYYSRARNLHKCAKILEAEYNCVIPKLNSSLLNLPGIGSYTASAIQSIAYDIPSAVVESNIERIISRLFVINTPLPQAKKIIKNKMEELTPKKRSGDFAQALMDLGADICSPKNPKCNKCPIQNYCTAYKKKTMETYPIKPKKETKPEKYGYVYVILNNKQQVLLEKRPNKGLLGGMIGFPTSEWETKKPEKDSLHYAKYSNLYITKQIVSHTFTHFHLFLTIVIGKSDTSDGIWEDENKLQNHAIPTLMKKVWAGYKEIK